LNVASYFDSAVAYSIMGGNDRAIFYDSAGDDVYTSRADRAQLQGAGYLNIAAGFKSTTAYAISGGNDWAEFQQSSKDLSIKAADLVARIAGEGYSNEVRGFDEVVAQLADEDVEVDVTATDFVFQLVGQQNS
jgi:hypothetical protein